jgi:hypothetical protein
MHVLFIVEKKLEDALSARTAIVQLFSEGGENAAVDEADY